MDGMPIGLIIREGFEIDDYIETARRAEAAKIHTLFTAGGYSTNARAPRGSLETLTMLCAIATHTSSTGLVATLSTTFEDPFNLARRLASLDHISHGRAGWNIVTSSAGAENFGSTPLPPHTERYERADEFTTILEELWTSWDKDAARPQRSGFVSGQSSGVHSIDHVGKYYSVKGPLDLPRSPQGRPILFQSGTSEEGMTVGVRHADAIFTTGLEHVEESRVIYNEVKARARKVGRNADDVKLFPGLAPVVGATDKEAWEIFETWRATVNHDAQRIGMRNMFGDVDVSGYDLDKPLPPEALPDESEIQGRQSRYAVLKNYLTSNPDRTLRDLLEYHAAGAGHWVPIGSPATIADQLQERWETGAADGFVIIDAYGKYPNGLRNILEGLIPELQRRGIYHKEYAGKTLRENLGVPEFD
jgi:N-acetyl-S-(2-succino)cysteine monooxygenase